MLSIPGTVFTGDTDLCRKKLATRDSRVVVNSFRRGNDRGMAWRIDF